MLGGLAACGELDLGAGLHVDARFGGGHAGDDEPPKPTKTQNPAPVVVVNKEPRAKRAISGGASAPLGVDIAGLPVII